MAKSKQTVPLKEYTSDKELAKIGARIRQLRKEAGYKSFEKLANELEVSRPQWGRYETGANITASTLIKICKALKISLKDFFSEGFD